MAEILLSLVYVYPFRCQHCGHRFRAFHWGRRYTRGRAERREYERIGVDLPARLSGLPGSAVARVTDLSIDGCSVITDVVLADGAGLELSFEASPGVRPILVEAAVVHARRPGGAGLVFARIAPHEQERLCRLVLDLMVQRRSV